MIGAQSDSISRGADGSVSRRESGTLESRASQRTRLVFGSIAVEIAAPELLCLRFYGEVVRAGVRLELPFCPGRVVVGQPRYALLARAQVPRRQTEVAVYASDNFLLGARGHILRQPGPWSICH